jgi:hypothetical protein
MVGESNEGGWVGVEECDGKRVLERVFLEFERPLSV